MSKTIKIAGVIIILLVIAVLAVPVIVHSAVKSKIDQKLENEFGGLAHYESVTVNWSPLGATLFNLTLGSPNPAAGNKPSINIHRVDVELHSIYDSAPRFSKVTADKIDVNISVDPRGESSLAKLIREKQPSKRKEPLTIDLLKMTNIVITTYIAKPNSNKDVGPDSILKVSQVGSTGVVLPIPGMLLGYEQWIPAEISSIEASGPEVTNEAHSGNSSIQPPLRISKISFEINQAENEEAPVRLRKFRADGTECLVEGANDQAGGFKSVINSIQKGFGIQEPDDIKNTSNTAPKPQGTGLLIEDFQSAEARIEMRAGGAFWRLVHARIDAGNLAFGNRVSTKGPGFIKIQSATESNTAPGQLSLNITDLSGSYPHSSFKCTYTIDHLSPAAFSAIGAQQKVTIKQGTVTVSFGGGATDGNLNMSGSVTLSEDFELQGETVKNIGAKLTLGKPIEGVTIDGTLEHPQIHLPNELALLSDLMGNILLGGPFTILDGTVGKIPVVGTAVNEATKTGSKVLSKIPIIGGLFKKDDAKDK